MRRRISDRLDGITPLAGAGLSALLVGAIAVLDHLTGGISLTDLYLLACFLGAWTGSTWGGLAITVLCGVAIFWNDRLLGFTGTVHVLNRWIQVSMLGVVSLLVAALRRSHAALRELAHHDALTGLGNRRAFAERLEVELAIARRERRSFTIAYFDLDHFKMVNDAHGHHEGDRVLCAVSRILMQRVRAADACARLGGDEFAILLRDTTADIGVQLLEHLRGALAAEMLQGGWPVTFSVGAVTVEKGGCTPDDVLRAADALMYEAKRRARGSVLRAVI